MILYFHRNPVNQEVFYVGVTCNHLRPYSYISRNKAWHEYISTYGKPIIEVVHEGLSKKQAISFEKYYINLYGKQKHGGQLVNKNDGGGGCHKVSKEHKKKISKANKGHKYNLGQTRPGRILSKEDIDKMTKAAAAIISKKVIDTNTGEIFESIKKAAANYGMSYDWIKVVLRGEAPNYTPLQYLN